MENMVYIDSIGFRALGAAFDVQRELMERGDIPIPEMRRRTNNGV